jgi:hypothetical protein
MQIPTSEPRIVQAGDTLAWRRLLQDYPAPTWVLKYRLINANARIDLTAAADGSAHLVTVTAAATAAWAAGTYTVQATVETATERYTIARGAMQVKPNLAAMGANFDARSHVRKALDDTVAALATWIASNGQVQEYDIAGRTMKYSNMAEIQKRIALLRREVAAEEAADKIAAGITPARRLLVRF